MRLNLFTIPIIPLLILFVPGFHASARAQQRNNDSSLSSVSGLVTIEGKPASGVAVALIWTQGGPERKRLAVTTDSEGRFSFVGVPPGSYSITPHAYAFVLANNNPPSQKSKYFVVGVGETIDIASLELVRGCVVTGRVVDEDGRPVIGGYVSLQMARRDGERHTEYVEPAVPTNYETDDRGVYRLFGIPPGRYLLRVRQVTGARADNTTYSVFYPDSLDESKAQVIELSSGEEKTGINITAVPPAKTYAASGRLIDAVSGKPVQGVSVWLWPLDGNEEKMEMVPRGHEVMNTKSDGSFRVSGLRPGQYRVSIGSGNDQGIDWYCDESIVDVIDEDVGGIELKAHRGGSISGVVIVEGPNDSQIARTNYGSSIWASSRGSDGLSGVHAYSRADANGRFRLSGLRAGEFTLNVRVYVSNSKRPSIQKVEVAGQPVRDTIELKEGQSISDARIVMVYGDGAARGQVKFQNGEAPKGACFAVFTTHKGECSFCQADYHAQVSQGGQYALEGLLPGEYELTLSGHPCSPSDQFQMPLQKQTIRVANGIETRADFVVDLNKKDK